MNSPNRILIAVVVFALVVEHAFAQPLVAPEPDLVPRAAIADAPAPMRGLAEEQQALAADYVRLEQKLRRLAQVSAATDPARAALLRQAFAESKERFVAGQLEEIARTLGEPAASGGPAYDRAIEGQAKAESDLKALADMLQSESRAKQAEEESRFLRELGQKLGRIIRSQEGIAGRTESPNDESSDDAKRLAEDQAEVAERTKELHGEVGEREKEKRESEEGKEGAKIEDRGARSEGNAPAAPDPDAPPSESLDDVQATPLEQRLKQAQQKMERARKKLEKKENKDAAADQQEALEALRSAQAEIEKILRQMREEHVERTLLALEQRYRAMLDAQIAVYDETKQLDKTPAEQRAADDEIKAARLGRREQEIVLLCERALALLREEGSTAALPEATEQVRDDMRRAAELLGQSRVDRLTQQVEQGVIAALDEILAAVKQAQADAKKGDDRPPGQPGKPGDPGLVDGLAELKMLRTMQAGVNRRLAQLSQLAGGPETTGPEATDPDIVRGLAELAQRQKRIVRITRDIVTGKTE